MAVNDWFEWHAPYDDPTSRLSARLALVQQRLRETLDRARPGPLRVISMCAGQGRDVLPVLASHPRGHDVTALLVEQDERNVAIARERAGPNIHVVCGDASKTLSYAGAVPADIVMLCGIFGNISDDDVRHTVNVAPSLCAPDATVIWTRHPRDDAIVPAIDNWFLAAGFTRIALDGIVETGFGVGVHQLRVAPPPYDPSITMFTFKDA